MLKRHHNNGFLYISTSTTWKIALIASRLFVAKIKSVVSVLFRLISESLSIGKQWGYLNFWTQESLLKLASLSPRVGLILHYRQDRPNIKTKDNNDHTVTLWKNKATPALRMYCISQYRKAMLKNSSHQCIVRQIFSHIGSSSRSKL